MVDVLPIAHECRKSITTEIARLDDFIQMAKVLEREIHGPAAAADDDADDGAGMQPNGAGDETASTVAENVVATAPEKAEATVEATAETQERSAQASATAPPEDDGAPGTETAQGTADASSVQSAEEQCAAPEEASAREPEPAPVQGPDALVAATEETTTEAVSLQDDDHAETHDGDRSAERHSASTAGGADDATGPAAQMTAERPELLLEEPAPPPEEPEYVLKDRVDNTGKADTNAAPAAGQGADVTPGQGKARGSFKHYLGALRNGIERYLAKPASASASGSAEANPAPNSVTSGMTVDSTEKVVSIARKPLAPTTARYRNSPALRTVEGRQPAPEGARPTAHAAAPGQTPMERHQEASRRTVSHVGQRVRHRRWMLGISRSELSRRVGTGPQQIRDYETGQATIDATRLSRIAAALDVPVAYFLEGLEGGGQEVRGQHVRTQIEEFSEDTIIFSNPRSA